MKYYTNLLIITYAFSYDCGNSNYCCVVSVQAVFFGGMAITTLRMKYLWTPYMCILGSTLVTDDHVYTWLLGKLRISSAALVSTYGSKLELMNFVGFL